MGFINIGNKQKKCCCCKCCESEQVVKKETSFSWNSTEPVGMIVKYLKRNILKVKVEYKPEHNADLVTLSHGDIIIKAYNSYWATSLEPAPKKWLYFWEGCYLHHLTLDGLPKHLYDDFLEEIRPVIFELGVLEKQRFLAEKLAKQQAEQEIAVQYFKNLIGEQYEN